MTVKIDAFALRICVDRYNSIASFIGYTRPGIIDMDIFVAKNQALFFSVSSDSLLLSPFFCLIYLGLCSVHDPRMRLFNRYLHYLQVYTWQTQCLTAGVSSVSIFGSM